MSLKVTDFKTLRRKFGTPTKSTPVQNFLSACDVQLRIIDGETVVHKVTKKPIKSWVKEVSGQKVVIPKVGVSLLLGKGKGYIVTKQMTAKKIISELKIEVSSGKHVRTINKLAHKVMGRPKKA